MATKGFTKISNSIIFDAALSLEALGLYIKLQHLSTIKDFSIKRDYVKSISGYGETAFRRVWKELKDKGVLIETKTRVKGRYEYVYTLKTNEDDIKATAPVEKKKPKHIDSDGNAPLNGQINIDDVLEVKKELPKTNENVDIVSKATGFKDSESKELLQISGDDIAKVINGYRYAMSQEEVKNIFAYTKWVIRNNKSIFEHVKRNEYTVKGTFNDFKQRKYDFKKLKNALLYGEPYELPV